VIVLVGYYAMYSHVCVLMFWKYMLLLSSELLSYVHARVITLNIGWSNAYPQSLKTSIRQVITRFHSALVKTSCFDMIMQMRRKETVSYKSNIEGII